MTDRVPWTNWMAYGLRHLKLDPAAFWSMSLAEWRAVLAGPGSAGTPLSRAEFDELCGQFPDRAAGLPAGPICDTIPRS